MRLLRMRPGFGEQLIVEGDVEVAEEEQALIEEFRHQLDQGMWAAVPRTRCDGRREAEIVRAFEEVPRDTERVIFFPRAAGGATCSRLEVLTASDADQRVDPMTHRRSHR